MERASHGAEGLSFASLCFPFAESGRNPLSGSRRSNGCGKGIGVGVGLGAAGSGGFGVFLDDAGRLLALDVAEFGWLDL